MFAATAKAQPVLENAYATLRHCTHGSSGMIAKNVKRYGDSDHLDDICDALELHERARDMVKAYFKSRYLYHEWLEDHRMAVVEDLRERCDADHLGFYGRSGGWLGFYPARDLQNAVDGLERALEDLENAMLQDPQGLGLDNGDTLGDMLERQLSDHLREIEEHTETLENELELIEWAFGVINTHRESMNWSEHLEREVRTFITTLADPMQLAQR